MEREGKLSLAEQGVGATRGLAAHVCTPSQAVPNPLLKQVPGAEA